MGVNNSGNGGIAGTLVSFMVDGDGSQLPFNFLVKDFTGGISFPTISRRGRGEGSTATATISGGAVNGSTGLVPGYGYLSAAVTLTGGGGTGGSLTATVSGGAVTGLSVAAGGSGYTAAPTIAITESSGETPRTKLGDVEGNGTLVFTFQNTGVPTPNLPKFATGTIRQIMQSEAFSGPPVPVDYYDFPARLDDIHWDHNDPKTNTWTGSAKWSLAGNPTATWRGTQYTISTPAANDVSTYEGMSKTYDANNLLTAATTRIDCETIGNSNAAEFAKLVAMWSTLTAPMTYMKLVTLALARTESNGVALVAQWSMNDSKDSTLYPKISTTDDAENIEDAAMRAQLWNTGSSPPALPTDLPTNNVKLDKFADYPLNPLVNLRVWIYGESNSRDRAVLPHYETTADASNLESTAMRACLDGESISDPAGYTLRLTKTIPLSFSLGINRVLTVKIYGLRTTAQDIELPNTYTNVDPDAIETNGKKTTVYLTSGGVPSDPSPPSNTQITSSQIQQINSLESQKEWIFRANKSGQEIVNAETISTRSPIDAWVDVVVSIIDSTADCSVIADAQWAVFKSDPNLVKLAVKRITPGKVKVVYFYENSGITVVGKTYGGARSVPARINSGTVEVYIAKVLDIDGTNSWMLHKSQQLRNAAIREFTVIETLTGTTIPDHESVVGKVNSTSFLGISAGKVLYMGAEYRTRYDVSGTRVFEMKYKFYEDANGIINYVGIRDEWFITDASASAGWVAASTFPDDIDASTPSTDDFATTFGL